MSIRQALGETRSQFQPKHAVISPDSHEAVTLPDWPGCTLVHLITPALGAAFSLFLVLSEAGATGLREPAEGIERFILRRCGDVAVRIGSDPAQGLADEGFAFLPAGQPHTLDLGPGASLVVLERRYSPLAGQPVPDAVLGAIPQVPAHPMKGDTRLMLQKLLHQESGFDLEINIMDFAPGASLPYVETHFMEHGLVMLNGGGIYRLEGAWYPVCAEDAIWMGPFCPQWFGAIGQTNARYLIYKNWNRDPLAG